MAAWEAWGGETAGWPASAGESEARQESRGRPTRWNAPDREDGDGGDGDGDDEDEGRGDALPDRRGALVDAAAAAGHAGAPVPSTRTRIRLRVSVGAAVALVGAALVAAVLVTVVQSAAEGPASGSTTRADAQASEVREGDRAAGGRAASAGDPDAVGEQPGSAGGAAAPAPDAADAVDGESDDGIGAAGSAGSPRPPIYVHVVGAVASPGLFPLAPGSRVVDALAAAHGFADGADTAGVNLARVLSDGEQLVVPRQGETPAPAPAPAAGPSGAGGGTATASAPVDLNTATAEQLETLPRVGPSLAARIIAWRSAHGRFGRVADLGRVPGIGDRTLASLTPLVRV